MRLCVGTFANEGCLLEDRARYARHRVLGDAAAWEGGRRRVEAEVSGRRPARHVMGRLGC
jgi:hypothetical protein